MSDGTKPNARPERPNLSQSTPSHSVLKVTQIGNSLGVVLPREVLADLNVERGDRLYFTRSPDGYRLTRSDPEFERQMTKAREIMRKRHDVLRELAK